ncbi:ferredoxin reductase [Micromonospora sp. CV4]|uniref:ferredoxin reductase n=1 Tax=Micromonospora sp. CV4 TaxID=2478711 RepID=UPI000EF559FB|nr:ferredoxin reductase [Micromonospora sp. CV4]RLP96031.1 oxidoreductase [Micromonospora sp. CV4]
MTERAVATGTPARAPIRWQVGRLVERRVETPSAQTLVLEVPDWPGHLPGQHVDLRLTAPDGYQAARSYSVAGPVVDGPGGPRIEVTVQRVPDGEVSPYLIDVYGAGDPVEVRGPLGGWFIWRPEETAPVQLLAGGSGIVPLMAMIRARRETGSKVPFRLLYSVRTPDDVIYGDELRRRVRDDFGLDVAYVYTREAPEGWRGEPHRIGLADVNTHGWPPDLEPLTYVCGPTGFVEAVADLLVGLGHPSRRVKTERFGPTG